MSLPNAPFRLDGRVALVTGGSGTLGSAMARGLIQAGARVAVLGRSIEKSRRAAADLGAAGEHAVGVAADVLDPDALRRALEDAEAALGPVDILVNAAGGNVPEATLEPGADLFGLPAEAMGRVVDLNLHGTILPTQVVGAAMAERGAGCVVNVSSMAACRVISRVVGYSAAKAAVDQYTRWMAVEAARRYGDAFRVNAIAPGFFVAEQNHDLLLNGDGSLTDRGADIIAHTPAGRFGEPEDVAGAVVFLCSPAARFVNGVVLPIDGGFAAFGGF